MSASLSLTCTQGNCCSPSYGINSTTPWNIRSLTTWLVGSLWERIGGLSLTPSAASAVRYAWRECLPLFSLRLCEPKKHLRMLRTGTRSTLSPCATPTSTSAPSALREILLRQLYSLENRGGISHPFR